MFAPLVVATAVCFVATDALALSTLLAAILPWGNRQKAAGFATDAARIAVPRNEHSRVDFSKD